MDCNIEPFVSIYTDNIQGQLKLSVFPILLFQDE